MSKPNWLDPPSPPNAHGRKDMPSTSNGAALTDQPLAGTLICENLHSWPHEVRQDFVDNASTDRWGVSESDHVRVWEIRLQPGQRVAAHRHIVITFGRR